LDYGEQIEKEGRMKGIFKNLLKYNFRWLYEVLYEDLYQAQFELTEYDNSKGFIGQLPHVWAAAFIGWILVYACFYSFPWVGLTSIENFLPWDGFKWEGLRLEMTIWEEFSLGRPV